MTKVDGPTSDRSWHLYCQRLVRTRDTDARRSVHRYPWR